MALIRGNLKTVKDVTEARNVLKQIANNPKFTEYGAKRLVKWHRKLTALAFAQQKDPDTSEEWAAPGFKTAKDGRFSKHLLMRSGALIKAATNPDVSVQTREGVSTATIKMPGEPFYAEFHQFGTSSIHKNSALVFQHDKSKRLESSYKRSTRTPARPFFPFASDNFSNYAAGKEIEKTALVVFEAVSKSILKRAIQLPTAEIEGYTSVVSFYTTAPMKARTAKSGRVVKAKNGAGQIRHARLDARLVGTLYTTKGARFHSELTESLQPLPKGPRSAKSLRHAHYQEVHRQSLLYRHAHHAEFAEQEAAAGAEGWRNAAQHLRKFQET
jgi:phage gpG-like protein